MRTILVMGVLAAIVLPSAAVAQPGKYAAAVVLPEIEMRAGTSWQFPSTGKLKKGEQVIIHHEDGAWVAILPPPGTVSWVNHRFLGEFDPNLSGEQNAIIMADNVEVRVGQEKGAPLGVTQVKLPRGTIVKVVGAKMREENTTWYPITPPEGEYRWLPKEALGAPSPLAPPPVFVKSDGMGGGNTQGQLASNPRTSANVAHPQWAKAEQAERTGDYATAEKLYTLILQDMRQKNADPEMQLICYNRITKCQDRVRLDGNVARPPTIDGAKPPASLQPPTGTNSGAVGTPWPNDPRSASTTTGGQRWSGPGHLRRAGFQIDNRQAYALENSRGQIIFYVTAVSGVSLDPHVNRQVDLYGSVHVRGEIRGGQYMIVSQVNAAR
jgi:hypothetical protein